MASNNKLNLQELKILVFEKQQATKQNKDRLFKLAKADKDIATIEKLRDELDFKSAKVYLEKLDNLSLNDAISNRDLDTFQKLVDDGGDISSIKVSELIEKKYDDEFIQIFIKQGIYVNIANLVNKKYKFETIKLALEHGANTNDKDEKYLDGLFYAVYNEQKEITKLLLEYKAKINKQYLEGITALMFSVLNKNADIVKLLLDNGADTEIKSSNGFTALIFSASENNIEAVKILLDHGANVNAQSANKGTALMFSIMDHNNFEMAKILLEKGANPNIEEGVEGWTALDWAERNKNNKIMNLLLTYNAIGGKKEEEPIPELIKAFLNNDIEKIEYLLALGHNINEEFNKINALIQFSVLGYVELVNLLLDYGANINYQTKLGWTALIMATYAEQIEVVQTLIQRGADKNIKGYSERTALEAAKQKKNNALINLLQNKKHDRDSLSPLKDMIKERMENDYKELMLNKIEELGVEKAIEHLQNISSSNELLREIGSIKKDSTPFIVRSLKRTILSNEEMSKEIIIKSAGRYDGSLLHESLRGIHFPSIGTNIGYFLDFPFHASVIDPWSNEKLPNGIDWNGYIGKTIDSSFIFLNYGNHIFLHNTDVVEKRNLYSFENNEYKLIKKMKNFNYSDGNIYNQLFNIVQNDDSTEILYHLQKLLDQNIDINKLNSNYKTALILAIENGNKEIVRILLDKGAEPNIQDKEGFTPLMIATILEYSEICKLLLDKKSDMYVKNYRGQNCALLAAKKMNPEIIILFEEQGLEVQNAQPYYATDFENENASKIAKELEEELTSRELISEFLVFSLDFNYEYELDLDYYIENNKEFLVSIKPSREMNFTKKIVEIYNQMYKKYFDKINANDKSKNNIRIKIFDMLMEKYQLGKYENSQFKEIVEENQNSFLCTLKITDIRGTIDVYDNYIILKLLQKDGQINSFEYVKQSENKYVNNERGEIIISKASIFEKDKNGNQRISKYSKIENNSINVEQEEHNPKALANILNKFSSSEKLKYTNHIWDSNLKYDDFMKNFQIEWDENKENLKILSENLHDDIEKFLFEEKLGQNDVQGNLISWGKGITIGFSSPEIVEWAKNGNKPEQYPLPNPTKELKTFKDAMETFKSMIVIKQNDKKLKLLKKFLDIKKDRNLEFDLSDLKEDKIDKFFTDVSKLEEALKIIFDDIEEIADENKEIKITAEDKKDFIEIQIIHLNSSSSKIAQQLLETIDKNGGNFQSIYKNLTSVCDWHVDAVCSDGNRYLIDYLYPKSDDNKPHYKQIGLTNEGFTHILRFYK